jgi:hypothetical protein
MVRKRVGKKYCSSYRGILVKLISANDLAPGFAIPALFFKIRIFIYILQP